MTEPSIAVAEFSKTTMSDARKSTKTPPAIIVVVHVELCVAG